MDRYKALEHIANGIQAGMRIRSIMSSSRKMNEQMSIKDSSRSNINEVLGVLAQYSPEAHKDTFNNSLTRSNQYSEAYSNLKRNFNSARTGEFSREMLVNTLTALRPVASESRKVAIDKILQILEILFN